MEGPGRAAAAPSHLLAVPNVTARPSTASEPTLKRCPLCRALQLVRQKRWQKNGGFTQ